MLASKQQVAARCSLFPGLATALPQRRRLIKANVAAPISPSSDAAVLKDERGFVLKQVG